MTTPLRIPGTNTYPDAGVICRDCRGTIAPGEFLVKLIYDGNRNGTGPALCRSCRNNPEPDWTQPRWRTWTREHQNAKQLA